MTAAALFETPSPVWTPDGCLAAVPAGEAANDNVVGHVGWAPDYGTESAFHASLPHVDESSGLKLVTLPVATTIAVVGHTGPEVTWLPTQAELTRRNMARFPVTHAALRTPLSFDHLPPVIALSGAAGSGKSTVSDFLAVRFGYTKTKFAAPLKAMCRAVGMTDARIEGDAKETPVAWLCGRTPRYFMQHLGLEFGRDMIGDDFWIGLWRREALAAGNVVVDDCRFANEAAAVRRMGGRVIRLIGRGGIAGGHASETADFLADEVICNDGSISDLQERVLEVLDGWQ